MLDAGVAAGLARPGQHAGGKRDDRNPRTGCTGIGADRARQRESVHVRHVAVGDHQIERPRLPGLEGLAAIRAGMHMQPQAAQALLQQVQVGGMVFGHQHPGGRQRRHRRGRRG
ncbi:hypothetical protein G6F60_015322 [Rhizopus arrhizus]|nr:hypothetical protein G6F60_015322 [Rhizopus arrhizus]